MNDDEKAAAVNEWLAETEKRRVRLPDWTQFAKGRLYRPVMRLAHKFGFCYPSPVYVDEQSVWCHWCGMRGKHPVRRPFDDERIA